MIKYSGNTINDWWRSSSAITKMMYNGHQAYRRKVRVLPTRWVVDDTSYLCVSYDKYEKEVKEYSLDDGITWTKYIPEISRPGDLIFSGSVDCGAAPQERWAVDASSYICEGYDKYEKEVKQYCLDDYGINWANYVPEISRKGNLIKQNARQCGYTGDTQEPCYAVVDTIVGYSDTEFVDVFNLSNKKWYKLNNLNQFEEYGVYGSGRNITYYEGKLTIDGDYEYIYSGSSWVNVGEVSGTTATLPDVPFSLNYNAANYNASTHTIPKTTGQLIDLDATAVLNPSNIVDHSDDGYITITDSSMSLRQYGDNNYQYLDRTDGEGTCEMTIVSKARTSNGFSLITNRDSYYNWMYRQYGDHLTLHGNSETGQISCSYTDPNILSVRTYYENGTLVQYNNWTTESSTSPQSFTYGNMNNSPYFYDGALFVGYGYNSSDEQWQGDFYWVYMSQHTLTDEQIQQVITYNEVGIQVDYPIYYDAMQAPPSALTFSTMEEAEEYECPYVGVTATISGTDYIFDENYLWVTKYQWVTVPNEYMCYRHDKYTKEQKQIRNVDDTWSNVTPSEFRKGSLIESGSSDCASYWDINLNDEWRTSTAYGDLADSASSYSFYESFSNWHITYSTATAYITINGYTEFTFKVRSNGEDCCDYVIVYDLDSENSEKLSMYYQSSYTSWTDVTFSNIDGGEHTIKVLYKKDGSADSYEDRGFIAIPNN